jgi:carbamoyltransferase
VSVFLGVTDPWGEDNAAAVLVDGELVATVEEERLSRVKHARQTPPARAIAWCLEEADCKLSDVDVVAVGFDEPRRIRADNVADLARRTVGGRRFDLSLRGEYLRYRGHKYLFSRLAEQLDFGADWRRPVRDGRLVFVRHHVAHAASAFFLSPFDHAGIVSLDGSGGQDAGLIGYGEGTRIEPFEFVDRELSWGILYERFTAALGFRPHNDEGKVMGLAAYGDHGGEPFRFVRLAGDGFPTYDRQAMYATLAEIRPRGPDESPINGYHEHLAARLQFTLEQALRRITEVLHERTGLTDLCLAGGVALNCSANGRLLELPHVERIFVQPAASDCGTALGAAVHVHVQRSGQRPRTRFDHAYWGPEYSNEEIARALDQAKAPYKRSDNIAADTARLIANGAIVGWFQGRTELGPRALGARSILADPRNLDTKDAVNRHAKFREAWRPFAPSLPEERMEEFFGTDQPSNFMILAFQAREEVKARIPATLHVDGSGRPQTVSRTTNPRYWQLLHEFEKLTGVPVVLNTSFNVDSEPIVCTPQDALRTFYASGIDALAIGDYLLEKQPAAPQDDDFQISATLREEPDLWATRS